MVGRYDEPMRSIGEVAESLNLPQHVLRFWETRFKEIDPLKRAGGRRLYRQRDIEIVVTIRHLLYREGYTIKGVQRILKEQGVDAVIEDVARRLAGDTPPPFGSVSAPEVAGSDGDVDETEAEAAVFDEQPSDPPLVELAEIEPPEPAPASSINLPALPEASPRSVDDATTSVLRDVLAEIEECQRLLKLTIR